MIADGDGLDIARDGEVVVSYSRTIPPKSKPK
jgi:hypothetical protein